MRKIICIVFCVLTIGMLALPALANAGYNVDLVYRSVLPYDYIFSYSRNGWNDVVDYPFARVLNDGDIDNGKFDYNDGDIFGQVALAWDQGTDGETHPYIYGTIGGPKYSSGSGGEVNQIELVMHDKVINASDLTQDCWIEYNRQDVTIVSTQLYVEYYDVSGTSIDNDDGTLRTEYVLDTISYSNLESYYPNQYISLGYQWEGLARRIGSNVIAVKYATFIISYRRVNVNTTYFDFHCLAYDNDDPFWGTTIHDWFDLQHLSVENTEIIVPPSVEMDDTMDWLINSVESFLETEFFPGFTFNKLILLILVIGIVLWFITLLI